jgi:hypothetical protein
MSKLMERLKMKYKVLHRPDGTRSLIYSSSDLNLIMKLKQPKKTMIKIVHWIPRVLCILAILFISMFAADAFDPRLTLLQQIGGFFIHLVPSFILAVFLIVAWKWELIGGIIFILLGVGFTPGIYFHNFQMNHSVLMSFGIILVITFPFILVGILFIISHYLKKKYADTAGDEHIISEK